jgi:hypothetical protein
VHFEIAQLTVFTHRIEVAMFAQYRLVLIVVAAVLVAGAALWWFVGASASCSSDDAAKAKALALSADMQAAAQQNKMTIEPLSETTRSINAAATTYTSTNDRGACCEAPDQIRADMKLAP